MSPRTVTQDFAEAIERAPDPLVLLAYAPADEQDAAAGHGDAAWLDLWVPDRGERGGWECIATLFLADLRPAPATVLTQLVAAGLDRELVDSTESLREPYVHGWRALPNPAAQPS